MMNKKKTQYELSNTYTHHDGKEKTISLELSINYRHEKFSIEPDPTFGRMRENNPRGNTGVVFHNISDVDASKARAIMELLEEAVAFARKELGWDTVPDKEKRYPGGKITEVMNSYGTRFKIGDVVRSTANRVQETGIIETFSRWGVETEEIKAHTDKWWSHIDFLTKEEQ